MLRVRTVEILEPDPGRHRQPIDRVGVLEIETDVVVQEVLLDVRRVEDHDRVRSAVREALDEVHVRVLERLVNLVPAVRALHPELHGVRAGHIGEGRDLAEADRFSGVVRSGRSAPVGGRGDVHLRNRVRRQQPGLQFPGRVRLVVHPDAGLEQQPAGPRARPFDHAGEVGPRRAHPEAVFRPQGSRHAAAAGLLVPAPLADMVDVAGQLIPRAHLPGQPRHLALYEVVVQHLPRGVRREAVERRGGRVERVGGCLVHAPVADRGEEPKLVSLEGAARRNVQVVHRIHRVGGPLPRVGVWHRRIRLQVVAGRRVEHVALQGVAAVLGDEIEADTAARGLDLDAAGLIRHLGKHAFIEVILVRAVPLHAVEANPLDQDRVVARIGTVRVQVALLHPL